MSFADMPTGMLYAMKHKAKSAKQYSALDREVKRRERMKKSSLRSLEKVSARLAGRVAGIRRAHKDIVAANHRITLRRDLPKDPGYGIGSKLRGEERKIPLGEAHERYAVRRRKTLREMGAIQRRFTLNQRFHARRAARERERGRGREYDRAFREAREEFGLYQHNPGRGIDNSRSLVLSPQATHLLFHGKYPAMRRRARLGKRVSIAGLKARVMRGRRGERVKRSMGQAHPQTAHSLERMLIGEKRRLKLAEDNLRAMRQRRRMVFGRPIPALPDFLGTQRRWPVNIKDSDMFAKKALDPMDLEKIHPSTLGRYYARRKAQWAAQGSLSSSRNTWDKVMRPENQRGSERAFSRAYEENNGKELLDAWKAERRRLSRGVPVISAAKLRRLKLGKRLRISQKEAKRRLEAARRRTGMSRSEQSARVGRAYIRAGLLADARRNVSLDPNLDSRLKHWRKITRRNFRLSNDLFHYPSPLIGTVSDYKGTRPRRISIGKRLTSKMDQGRDFRDVMNMLEAKYPEITSVTSRQMPKQVRQRLVSRTLKDLGLDKRVDIEKIGARKIGALVGARAAHKYNADDAFHDFVQTYDNKSRSKAYDRKFRNKIARLRRTREKATRLLQRAEAAALRATERRARSVRYPEADRDALLDAHEVAMARYGRNIDGSKIGKRLEKVSARLAGRVAGIRRAQAGIVNALNRSGLNNATSSSGRREAMSRIEGARNRIANNRLLHS